MTKTIKLTVPFEWEGRKINELTVRRPKVRDIRETETDPDKADIDRGILMTALLTDLPPEAIEEMDAADFMSVSEVVQGFLPGPPSPEAGGS